jgi:hypothetical protein
MIDLFSFFIVRDILCFKEEEIKVFFLYFTQIMIELHCARPRGRRHHHYPDRDDCR